MASGVDSVKTRRWRRNEQSEWGSPPSPAWRTRMAPTVSGIDGVKMVGRARGAAHAQDANSQWSRRCEDGGSRQRCEDGGTRRWRRNEQSDWALLLCGVAHAHDADGQWNRLCEDGGARKRCDDGGVRRIIGSKQGRTIWGSMDTVAWSMMDAAAVGSSAGS